MYHRGVTAILSAGVLALAASACANRVAPEVLQSAGYAQGYSDGCLTGNQRTSKGFPDEITRNDVLFKNDENYAIGWRQGFSVCGGSQETNIRKDPEILTTDRFDQGPI